MQEPFVNLTDIIMADPYPANRGLWFVLWPGCSPASAAPLDRPQQDEESRSASAKELQVMVSEPRPSTFLPSTAGYDAHAPSSHS